MDAAAVNAPGGDGAPGRAGYRRSAGSPRGEARRRELLDRVTDDLAINGLVDFSLRRAARAAGTTHKVLLYYFDGADDLLKQAILQLRDRRIDNTLAAASQDPARPARFPHRLADQRGHRGSRGRVRGAGPRAGTRRGSPRVTIRRRQRVG